MIGIKYSHCLKVCETTYGMTKYLSTCKVWQKIARCTILCQIQCGTNDIFTIPKAEATLSSVEQIERIYSNEKEEGLYTNNVERIDPVGTAGYIKKTNGEKMNLESMCIICTWLRSGIQST